MLRIELPRSEGDYEDFASQTPCRRCLTVWAPDGIRDAHVRQIRYMRSETGSTELRPSSPFPDACRDKRQPRSKMWDAVHVFTLASFAIAQPAYDRLGQNGAFLADHEIRTPAILLLVFVVSVALPAMLVLLENLSARFGRVAYDGFHTIVVFALTTLVALNCCRHLEFLFSGLANLILALGLAAALAWRYFGSSRVRALISLSSPAIVIFPVTLLLGSSVTGILFPPGKIQAGRWSPVPVVVLVFDEICGSSLMTPDREIDAVRFPNFAELARQSTWFRNASTVHSTTCQAVPAILSGKYPTTTWPPLPADLPQNLFSTFESTGNYELAVFEPVSSLAPIYGSEHQSTPDDTVSQFAVLADAFWRVYLFQVVPSDYWRQLPGVPRSWFGVRDTWKVDRAKRRGVFRYDWCAARASAFDHFLKCLGATPNPTLHFAHFVLPHIPWCHLPSGRQYLPDGDVLDLLSMGAQPAWHERWGTDELLVLQGQQRYLLQLQYADRMLGRVLQRLRETGLFDECLLIVMGDHGVSFRTDQPRRNVTTANAADIASIPLFIKRPHEDRPAVSDRRAEAIDIFPTIAEIVGIELRESIDGCSLFDESQPPGERTIPRSDPEMVAFDGDLISKSDVPRLIRRRFGDPRDAAGMYRIGPAAELVGRTIDAIEMTADRSVELEFLRYGDVVDNAPGSLVPCFFEGYVRSPQAAEEPTVLALSINGTIRAVTRTYQMDGFRDRWAAMVPESSFHPGHNDVRFLAVTGISSAYRLAECRIRPHSP